MKKLKDNFSKQAAGYSKFRPAYPDELYKFLYKHCKDFDLALDCATGNGQVAQKLSERFATVEATDISDQQISHGYQAPNIRYSVQRAEVTDFPDASFDLIAVGQAYHWFDFAAFGKEANRLLKKDGLIATWSYHLLRFNNKIDQYIDHFYKNVTGPYWDEERKWVDDYYRNVPFYFDEIHSDFNFQIKTKFSLEELGGYLNTWSAVRHFLVREGYNPVDKLIDELRGEWAEKKYSAIFPGFVRLGRKRT